MKANAHTTLQQFGGNRALLMIGGKASADSDGTLLVRFKGSRRVNLVSIALDANDTYMMTFSKYSPSKFTVTKVKEFEGIYCDQLAEAFEQYTGLFLSL
jgi:hypothetical protein